MTQVILSSNQVHRLHHRFFIPKGDILATLLIVHGMSEHSGRYENFAKYLAGNGILVATYDQLGHGKTVKDKYELGFFDEKHPIQALCKDVVIMADKTKELAPNVPHFIMGHSMGSFIVRSVLIHHSMRFCGAILMGSGNGFGPLDQMLLITLGLLNKIQPKQPNKIVANLINQYLLGQLSSPISASPFAWLAENNEAIQAFENDPLCGFIFTNNGFLTLQAIIKKSSNNQWYIKMPRNYPILFLSGNNDPVGHFGQDIKHLHKQLLNDGKNNVTKKLYPNMRHDILHEQNALQVYQDVLLWLKNSSQYSLI